MHRFDLVPDFASHLLFDIMCDLMEVRAEDRDKLRPIATMSWVFEATTNARERDESSAAIGACIEFLTRHVADVLDRSTDGFLATAYRALPPEEEDKTRAVATIACVMLVMGNNALATCIVGGVHKLLTQEEKISQADWARVSDDAVRFVAPVDFLNRFADRDVVFGGCPMKANDRVIVSPMLANHDTAEFGENAASIGLRDNANVGLTFGAGGHICVGNRMSRTIIKMAFAALATLPNLRLAGEPVYGRGKVVRTYASLPLQSD
jgi:cytochrome P450